LCVVWPPIWGQTTHNPLMRRTVACLSLPGGVHGTLVPDDWLPG